MKQLDIRRLDLADLTMKRTPTAGVVFLGRTADGIEIYQDCRKYINWKGQAVQYIDPDKVVMTSKKIFRAYHGPVTLVDKDGPEGSFITYVQKEVPVRHASRTTNNILQSLYSRPMIVPKNVDGWTVMDVV